MANITLERLRTLCDHKAPTEGNFRELAQFLGALVPWWVRPDILAETRKINDSAINGLLDANVTFSRKRGACWIVLTLLEELSLLRSAVPLPLVWEPNKPHSTVLPQKLRRLSDEVVSTVCSSSSFFGRASNWGLQPDPRLALDRNKLDDALFETWESGWASLTAGLVSGVLGVEPNGSAWCSCAWSKVFGPKNIAGLGNKLELARTWNEPAKSFAVPKQQIDEQRVLAAQAGIKLIGIVGNEKLNAMESLAPFLAEYLSQPPPPQVPKGDDDVEDQESLIRCSQYYLLLPAFELVSAAFYRSHLLPLISWRCRQQVRRFGQRPASHFVTVVSQSPEVAVIGARAVEAKKVLLLHTADLTSSLNYCREELKDCELVLGLIDTEEVVNSIRTHVEEFTRGITSVQDVVVDIKPGTTEMTYAILNARQLNARDSKSASSQWRVICLSGEGLPDRRVRPGTEKIQFL